MSHPNTWGAKVWADLVAADKLHVTINADGITYTMLFSELVKHTLATGDISWLSTIAIGAAEPAEDFLPFWEADANAFRKLLFKDLVDRLLSSGDIDTWMPAFANLAAVANNDEFTIFDTSAPGFKRLNADEILRYLRVEPVHHTANFSLSGSDGYKRHTNRGATSVITASLPAATQYWRMKFCRVANYNFEVDPNGSESIHGGLGGKKLIILARGEVELECVTAGEIEVIGGSAVWDWEP